MAVWEYEKLIAEEAEYRREMQEFFDQVDQEIEIQTKAIN